jgi:hypothetical protein
MTTTIKTRSRSQRRPSSPRRSPAAASASTALSAKPGSRPPLGHPVTAKPNYATLKGWFGGFDPPDLPIRVVIAK